MYIYLDHNATTPLATEALVAMQPYLTEGYGNAASIHWAGTRAKEGLERARERVAALIGANPKEIVFTSGATESINTALKGAFRPGIGGKNHLLISAVEHQATLETAESLISWGVQIGMVPVDSKGRIDPNELARQVRPETRLVSILWANNETGNLYPIEEIAKICKEKGVWLHVDAAQAAGKVSIDLQKIPIDFLSLSAHKLYGPQGVGALFIQQGRNIRRLHDGGGQERNRRGGTENIAGIVGFGAAAQLAQERRADDQQQATDLIAQLREGIHRHLPDAIFYGDSESYLANTLYVGFPGITSEALLVALDLEGIAVSSGAACSSGTIEPSHVLRAMGATPEAALSAVRFSVGRNNRRAEIERVLSLLPQLVRQLKAA